MKETTKGLITILVLILILTSCAIEKPPTGGPEDTEPPFAKLMEPKNLSTRFITKTIEIEFNEKIAEVQLAQKVIISPAANFKLKPKVVRKTLYLEIDGTPAPNTTYTLYFPECIQDITKPNKIKNLKYVFSTGEIIDTAYIKGNTTIHHNNQTSDKTLVGLYPPSDTVNIQKHKPIYFTKCRKDGSFRIDNLKAGTYSAYAFIDNNNNLTYDKEEEVGFLDNYIQLDSNLRDIDFNLFLSDEEAPKWTKRESKYHMVITPDNPVKQFTITDSDFKPLELQYSESTINPEYQVFKSFETDTFHVKLISSDLNDNLDTTSFYFKHPRLNKDTLEFLSLRPVNKKILAKDSIILESNIPVKTLITNKIRIFSDSIELGDLSNFKHSIQGNNHIIIHFDTKATTNLNIVFDSASVLGYNPDILNKPIDIKADILDPTQVGSISGELRYTGSNYFEIQLMKGARVIRTSKERLYKFINLPPAEYTIQVKIDHNGNGKFDQGRFDTRTQPEKILFHKDKLILRANWEMEGVILRP